eukprot:TRINITY_DN57037_c0_g1_i1.p1 TRINITY_DN57037_c0_g1~~TRINITY_DN57037_c0_g1_i1.p1  ORF type:complete len:522 (+),score=7.96 TRINITY_DN57037_c0_g1_i1:67-1566(+)
MSGRILNLLLIIGIASAGSGFISHYDHFPFKPLLAVGMTGDETKGNEGMNVVEPKGSTSIRILGEQGDERLMLSRPISPEEVVSFWFARGKGKISEIHLWNWKTGDSKAILKLDVSSGLALHHDCTYNPRDKLILCIGATLASPPDYPKELLSSPDSTVPVSVSWIVEINMQGEITWKWSTLEHLKTHPKAPKSQSDPTSDCSQRWDQPVEEWMHLNNIDWDIENNLITISDRTSNVLTVDRATGELVNWGILDDSITHDWNRVANDSWVMFINKRGAARMSCAGLLKGNAQKLDEKSDPVSVCPFPRPINIYHGSATMVPPFNLLLIASPMHRIVTLLDVDTADNMIERERGIRTYSSFETIWRHKFSSAPKPGFLSKGASVVTARPFFKTPVVWVANEYEVIKRFAMKNTKIIILSPVEQLVVWSAIKSGVREYGLLQVDDGAEQEVVFEPYWSPSFIPLPEKQCGTFSVSLSMKDGSFRSQHTFQAICTTDELNDA